MYGALRVPKQFMGFTDDATGFNGGTSLTIISSRYAKMIKRI
uniref:Portal vertex protein n=1 Tax=virus sp. ctnRj46 TaxID=2826814 RepID=A0A8S5R7L5_9VIRU|nr:MAG TPA: portal vertex protein [virus sp. ctnRj46]